MRIENRVKDLKKNFLCVEDKNMKKSEKDITKIDEKVPAELKKEKSIFGLQYFHLFWDGFAYFF